MSAVLESVDQARAEALTMKIIADITATNMGTLSVIGDRLGLFRALAAIGPASSDAFADHAAIDRRYAREWLSAMACHGYVDYDPTSDRFSMSPEQVFCLVDEESPAYLGGLFGTWPDFWRNVDALTDVFQDGGGISQDKFGTEWRCGFERFSRPGFLHHLCTEWIPSMPEIEQRLRAGGAVADVGCGNGQAAIQIARCFPEVSVVGFDLHVPAVASARGYAEEAGLADRVRFEIREAERGLPGSYDLITCFDVVHDMPQPVEALRAIRQALAPGGSLFVLEFNFSSDLADNIDHPFGIGAFGYAASVNYCMTTALAAGGVGTGTCMGERVFREYAEAAGFREVRRIDFPANPLNIFFEARA